MRARIALMILLASLLLLTACRLSDEQQIGVLKFVASSITGAIDDARPVAPQVKAAVPHRPCSQQSALAAHRAMWKAEQKAAHRMQHAESRIQYAVSRMARAESRVARCRVQVETLPAKIVIHWNVDTLRRLISIDAVTVARTCRTRPAPAVRS